MATITVENYLKRILQLQAGGRELVPMGALAGAMRVTPGTVTTMAKALATEGWLEHRPREGVRLTESGRQLAANVVRRHRLIETFLVKILKMDWAEVHVEAEELEHAVSERLLERIDAALGRPKSDPHGDPIPSLRGALSESLGLTLASCPVKASLRVLRVRDQTPAFLGLVEKAGLKPGARVRLLDRDLVAGVVQVGLSGRSRKSLGMAEAAKIEVGVVE